MDIDIDTASFEELVDKLESLRRKHLPYAIKETLNEMANAMKKGGGLEKSAKELFDHNRSATFIRAITWAEFAKGTDINSMVSGAGVATKTGKDKVADRMEFQEEGGTLKRGYTPNRGARARGDIEGQIRGSNRHFGLDYTGYDLVDKTKEEIMISLSKAASKSSSGKKQAVRMRGRKKGRILLGVMTGKMDVFRKNKGLTKSGRKRRGAVTGFRYGIKFMYTKNDNKKVTISKRPFVKKAGEIQKLNFNKYFRIAAEKQIQKAFDWAKK